ncbi:MAG: T9SS type A sorting domain-containing protein [Saprospiraceae bacterium]|nr:T9SS type A sorting domain-containing protein [Saprospiraceae bacterium]MCF8248444.1 T9SS type A sorting domain-containing protein [Saprospiraceae bacterium]MCF8281322.1 T9SS type A sorting domain-containing protein [Bacteroidales bacterium]MCF8309972.1 T9SS type A sorting domain-containing protein [Saprospiraceae bacterium]MCF8438697.1 T9SS type A sorting domain-containing protein [Saprospiraceae bacterium]
MKATINRIAILVAVLLPILAIGQTFPTYLYKTQQLPNGHPKIAQQQAQAEAAETPPTPPAAVYPVCVFDEMNEELRQSNPAFAQELQHYIEHVVPTLSASNPDKSMIEPLLTISVVVHVIHNGEPIGQGQNLSAAQIQAQIDILNEDYSALNSQFYNTPSQWMGAAGFPNIQFCLANKKPNGTPTDGIDRQQMTVTGTTWNNNNINSTIKPAIKWDPLRYFNIYVLPIPGTTSQGGVVGFSNYPVTGQIGSNSDGVVIDYRWFGAPGFPTSGYRPLTHETGHYLGLPHPFNGGSCALDDGIGDTPNIEVSTRDLATLNCASSYPNGPVSCGNEHMYVNYMDYVTENCYTSFTAGQVNVMRAVLNGTSSGFGYGSRNGLIQNAPAQCSIPATDAGVTRVVNPQNISCTTSQITPVVTLRNFGTNNLTSANILFKINNNAPVSFAWTGSLFAGQNLDVSLAPFTPMAGSYTLTAWTTQPNGLADQRISNDTTAANRYTYIATSPPMAENFENETSFPTSEGVFQLNVSSDDFVWQLVDSVSAYGQGSYSAVFDNYHDINGTNPFGTIDALITRHFDLTNMTGSMLKFDVAYAPYIEDIGDSLIVLVATDCSQNFNQQVYKKGGMSLATAPITTSEFTPTASQWRTEIVDLSAFDGMTDLTIALVNKSAFGNRLFVDNIGVGKNCSLTTASTSNPQPDDCFGSCIGAATINVGNHNGGLHYQWEGFPSSFDQPTNNELCAGTTSVTVTDLIGCTSVVNVQIEQEQAPQLATTFTAVTVYGGSDGTASVTVSNSTGPYSYDWSHGFAQNNTNNSTSTATGLSAGSYAVTVTAGNGCTATATVVVGSVCAGFSVSTSITQQPCSNASNGFVASQTQSGTAPVTYLWSNGQTTASATNLSANTYTVTVTDSNGCPATSSISLTALPAITLTVTPTHQTMAGENDGAATANASGGGGNFSYLWSNGMSTNPITGLAPGNYSVTTTDANGCTASASTTINSVNCGGFSANLAVTNLNCFGANNGTASAVPSGGTSPVTYLWSNGAATASIQNLPAGAISVSVTDGLGCLVQLDGTVTQPAQLLTNAFSINETMPAANDGSASVAPTGGTIPHVVLWSTGATTLTINNLAPGIYSVTLTDGNMCIASSQVTVQASTCFIGLQFTSTPTTCPDLNDGSATVSIQSGGTGPFSFLWSNGQTTASISTLIADNYQVTVTDAGGCTATGQVTVNSNDTTPPTIEILSQVVVVLGANGTATIDPSQLVSNVNDNCSMVFLQVFPESVDCSNVGNLQVTVTGTDSSNNQVTAVTGIVVSDEMPPVITCPGNISVNDCGPVTYMLPIATDNCSTPSLDLMAGFESGQVFPIGTTTVTWAANDVSLNVSTCSFEVMVNYDLAVAAQTNEPSCYGASDGSISLIPSGGQPPYNYIWSGGNGGNLPAGNYSFTITDFNGCAISETVVLTQPDEITIQVINITPATTGQSNGQIDFVVNGGTTPLTLSWLQGGAPLPNFDPMAAAAGSYQLRVEDANGCLLLSGLIAVGSVSAVGEELLAQKITISPNPSTGIFTLKMDGIFEPVLYSVFDGTGRRILDPKIVGPNSTTEMLDLQPFSTGFYWVKIVAGEAVVWKKLVKI